MAVAILAQVDRLLFGCCFAFSCTPSGDCSGTALPRLSANWASSSCLNSVPRAFYEARQLGSTIRFQFFYFLFMNGEGAQKHSSSGLFPTSPKLSIRFVLCFVWFKFKTHQKTSFHNKVCFVSKSFVISFLPNSK